MNPCPRGGCGQGEPCRCSEGEIRRYRGRLSGPLIDRIDLHVWIPKLPRNVLLGPLGESSGTVRARVEAARARQLHRAGKLNAQLSSAEITRWCTMEPEQWSQFERSAEQLDISARGIHRVLRVARTLADMEAASNIEAVHWREAIGYRQRLDDFP